MRALLLALAWILALVLKAVSMSAERVIGAARACPALVRSDVRRLRRRPTRSSDHGLRRVTGPRDLGGVQARATAPDAPSTSSATAAGTGRKVSRNPKVCVVGGGFGGLYTALRLSTLVWPGNSKPEITLEYFCLRGLGELPRLILEATSTPYISVFHVPQRSAQTPPRLHKHTNDHAHRR